MIVRSIDRMGGALPILITTILLWLVLAPIVFLAISAVKPTGMPFEPGFTLDILKNTYSDAAFWKLTGSTLVFAVASTTLATLLGGTMAWLVERSDLPGRNIVRVVAILPMVTPPFLLAIGWIMLLSPRTGVVNHWLMGLGASGPTFNIFTMSGMVFVETIALMPSAFLILSPAFRNMDPSLEESALASGASAYKTLTRIALPMILPAILSAWIFIFIVCFVVFDIPATIGIPSRIYLLSTEIYELANQSSTGLPRYATISSMSLLVIFLLIFLIFTYRRITKNNSRYVTVTGKNFRPRQMSLGRYRWFAFALVCCYFVLSVIAPIFILAWNSFMPFMVPISDKAFELFTLQNHIAVLQSPQIGKAIFNTINIAVAAASAVTIFSLLISWATIKLKVPGSSLIDILAFLPLGIPGIILATALIYTYLVFSAIPIYGSIWIIAIAYMTLYLSFGTRSTNGVLMQFHNDLEAAARVNGATGLDVFRRILFPLEQNPFTLHHILLQRSSFGTRLG